jgi:hypothetical protein
MMWCGHVALALPLLPSGAERPGGVPAEHNPYCEPAGSACTTFNHLPKALEQWSERLGSGWPCLRLGVGPDVQTRCDWGLHRDTGARIPKGPHLIQPLTPLLTKYW